MWEALVIGFSLVLSVCIMVWLTILPTIGLLWSIGVLK